MIILNDRGFFFITKTGLEPFLTFVGVDGHRKQLKFIRMDIVYGVAVQEPVAHAELTLLISVKVWCSRSW